MFDIKEGQEVKTINDIFSQCIFKLRMISFVTWSSLKSIIVFENALQGKYHFNFSWASLISQTFWSPITLLLIGPTLTSRFAYQ